MQAKGTVCSKARREWQTGVPGLHGHERQEVGLAEMRPLQRDLIPSLTIGRLRVEGI